MIVNGYNLALQDVLNLEDNEARSRASAQKSVLRGKVMCLLLLYSPLS